MASAAQSILSKQSGPELVVTTDEVDDEPGKPPCAAWVEEEDALPPAPSEKTRSGTLHDALTAPTAARAMARAVKCDAVRRFMFPSKREEEKEPIGDAPRLPASVTPGTDFLPAPSGDNAALTSKDEV